MPSACVSVMKNGWSKGSLTQPEFARSQDGRRNLCCAT